MQRFILAFAITAALSASLARADVIATGELRDHADTKNLDPTTDISAEHLAVGHSNNGTLLIDTNAAVNSLTNVTNLGGVLGYVDGATGIGTVSGAGATWTNNGGFWVGNGGNGTLTVELGGIITSSTSYIGNLATSTGIATITGTGSAWNKAGGSTLFVGFDGDGTLNIEDAATITSHHNYIGYNPNSTGEATVTGANSTWTNSGVLYTGYNGDGTLNILDGGKVTSVGISYNAFGANTTSNITINGTDSSWTNSGELRVGQSGNATISIEAGGALSNTHGYLGLNPNASGTVTVTGTDSTWTNTGNFQVGSSGDGTLLVEAGGKVSNTGVAYIGTGSTSTGIATINGTNSSWTNGSTLYVGYSGDGTLLVEDGATVSNHHGYLGFNTTTAIGSVTVTGPGSSWTSTGEFRVGNVGNGTLIIENGGSVSSNSNSNESFIATSLGRTGVVTITGANSAWTTNDKTLYAGYSGTATINIEDGGSLSNGFSYLGWNNGSTANATVTGTDASLNPSTWTSSDTLRVGNSGNATLLINAGGSVSSNATSYIATGSTSTSTVTVTGANSSWTTNDNELYVGNSGDATLNIEAGGNVSNSNGYIGGFSGSTSSASITGANSSWINSNNLTVGFNIGSNGTLNIDHGGTVSNTVGFIGNFAGSTGTVNVTGANALWDNTDNLYVGGTAIAAGGNGTLNVNTDGIVDVANTLHLWNTGNINLFGGTLKTAQTTFTNNTLNFIAGTLQFTQTTFFNPTDATNNDINTLSAGKTLRVDGTTLLGTPITLSGGKLSTDSISGFNLINFQSGTFELTSDNMTVGTGGIAGPTVDLAAGKHIDITNNATVNAEGLLHIQGGSFSANTTTNNGQVQLNGLSSLLGGGTLANNAFVAGNGRVSATLNNNATGQVDAIDGEKISFFGSGNTNAGTINANNATIEFSQDLTNSHQVNVIDGTFSVGSTATNNASGSITARDANLQFNGGLTNDGAVGLSFGNSDVFGNITNNALASVAVTGASTATFQGDIVNNGEFRVSTGSTAVFFGAVSGAGAFVGSGTVYFEDAFSPGNSPGTMTFTNTDVVFNAASDFNVELGGTGSAQYDAVTVTQGVTINGSSLNLSLIDGYKPVIGHTFKILDTTTRTGEFNSFSGVFVAADLTLVPVYDYLNDIGLTVIATRPGDVNFDGLVNVNDLGVLAANFTLTGRDWQTADFNFDGLVNVNDLGVLSANWTGSQVTFSEALQLTVFNTPEPTTAALLSLITLTLINRRRTA